MNRKWESERNTFSCKDAILPSESGVCDRICNDSDSAWSTGVRGNDGGVAVGRGGAGPLLEDVEPLLKTKKIHKI